MRLTIAINLAEQTAVLVEKHALSAGDTYDPLVLDFSSLDQSALAAVDTSSLELVVYKSRTDMTPVASTNLFSAPSGQAKLRTSMLLVNQQAVLDWYTAAGAGSQEAYLVISDVNTTYASCPVSVVLRPFVVGTGSTGYYTSTQVDEILRRYQPLLEAVGPLDLSAGELSIAKAAAAALGVVMPGAGLSVDGNGVLTVQFPEADDAFDTASDNPIANAVVANAVTGLTSRLDAILAGSGDAETGRLKTLETAVAGKADSTALARVANTGSYNDLSDKPTIPDSAVSAKWKSGTGITGTSVEPTVFPLSGIASAVRGDMYLNTDTADTYMCEESGDADTATWSFVCNIRGVKGDTGAAGSVTVHASYETKSAMDDAFVSDNVPFNGLVVLTTGTDRGKMYRKGRLAYELVVQLKGDKGDAGDAPVWMTGTAVTGENTVGASFSVAPAKVGDMYLNSTTGGVYRCTAATSPTSTWVYVCLVKGSPGLDGADGATFRSGSDIAAVAGTVTAVVTDAKVGDVYLTSAGNLFRCTSLNSDGSSVWEFVMKLSGVAGRDGTTWFHGVEVSSAGTHVVSGTPKVGDYYVNTATRVCYVCTSVDGPVWAESFVMKGADGMDGADGSVFHSGTEVTGPGAFEVFLVAPHVGDMYINTESKDLFRCLTVNASTHVSSWSFIANLVGVTAPASVTEGFIPTWASASSLAGGYSVLTSLPASAAAGVSSILTASAVWTALDNLRNGFVMAPSSHVSGYIPAWANDASLTAGYQIRTAVRQSGAATDHCLVTEAAVRAAIGAGTNVQESGTHTENYIPQWGSGATLENGLALVTSVRTGTAALNTAVATEAAVRAACTAIEELLNNKKLDALAAPVAGGVNLDATTTTHGLMPSADKVKLDNLVDTSTVEEIGAALADDDEVTVKDVSLTDAFKFRKFQITRIWAYVRSKLPNFALDDLGTPSDSAKLDATASHHGLLPRLPADDSRFLRGDGAWATPPGSTVFGGDEGEGGTQGQVPAPSAGDGADEKFLKADGTWAVPPLQTESEHISIDGQNPVDALANADVFLLYDRSESAFRKVTAQNLSRFVQASPHFDTVFVPAGAMTPLGTDGAIAEPFSFAANRTIHDILRFLNAKDTYADFDFVFPDDWDLGSIKMRVLWVPYNSDGAAEQWVRFKVAAKAYGDGEDLSSALGIGTDIDDQQIAVNQLHRSDASADITVRGTPAAGKAVHFKIAREYGFNNGGDGTALGTGACVLGVEIQYCRTVDYTGW